jgi:hypothetical protein
LYERLLLNLRNFLNLLMKYFFANPAWRKLETRFM